MPCRSTPSRRGGTAPPPPPPGAPAGQRTPRTSLLASPRALPLIPPRARLAPTLQEVKFKGPRNRHTLVRAAVTPDGAHVTCGSDNGWVYAWDAYLPAAGSVSASSHASSAAPPDGERAACAGASGPPLLHSPALFCPVRRAARR